MGTDAALPSSAPPEQRLADRLAAQQMPPPMSTRARVVTVLRAGGEAAWPSLRPSRALPPRRWTARCAASPLRRIGRGCGLPSVAQWPLRVAAPAGGRPPPDSWRSPSTPPSSTSDSSLAARRRRPDRDSAGVAGVRRVPMPASASFPGQRVRLRLHECSRAYPARGRRASGHARQRRRILPRPHRSALPRRRGHRGRDRLRCR